MDIAKLKHEYEQAWREAKSRLEAAQQAAREATIEGLRIEGALKALAEVEQAHVD